MGVRQGVAMNSPKYHPGPPCPSLPCLAGGLPLQQPYNRFRVHVLPLYALRAADPEMVFVYPMLYAPENIPVILNLML
jgi:hypothetical protein